MVAAVAIATPSRTAKREDSSDALAEIERQFHAQLSPLRLFPGAALAVYWNGRLMLALADG